MEGALHKFLKETVADELQRQNYSIYYEPLESPLKRLWWNSYRPDVLAMKSRKSNLDVIFVECETKPNRKRVLRKTEKIKKYISLQKELHENATILPLLIIPPFNLNKIISSQLRQIWEIWIINNVGEIKHKISQIRK